MWLQSQVRKRDFRPSAKHTPYWAMTGSDGLMTALSKRTSNLDNITRKHTILLTLHTGLTRLSVVEARRMRGTGIHAGQQVPPTDNHQVLGLHTSRRTPAMTLSYHRMCSVRRAAEDPRACRKGPQMRIG